MIEIRTFVQTDRGPLRELFLRAGEGAPGSMWGHAESEAAIYLDPYVEREPESLFVAVADGALVGYLSGCLDSATFPTDTERIGEAIKKYRLIFRPGTVAFFARATIDVVRAGVRREPVAGDFADPRWPSHLHINVAPEGRGTGVADGLMERWFDRLREAGSPGCHLQTLAENTRAVRFFERMGFVKHGPTPLVPGIRDDGRRLHQQTMVRTP
ncbi:Acetyltransferase (GNAT) family protein [Micromonospora pattaloongensis]|uniref:Acetyltransferase (GNAT) family protein n=1 Tax=Micromonospora pattaloongensis TaxID=405436 RepID=A0A1H3JLH6_9ACTN|nr:GNAT family N-acetyltransferase [Micromonospora pattaloongensis]SDY40439.1 Acetyltransferase (GNAT) family protein [Micromonospora pattaloongensis]